MSDFNGFAVFMIHNTRLGPLVIRLLARKRPSCKDFTSRLNQTIKHDGKYAKTLESVVSFIRQIGCKMGLTGVQINCRDSCYNH